MLKIGDFSKLSRISIRMLRYYDEKGLLIPKAIDDFTGYRQYSEDQLLTASRITSLKDMGFNISTIVEILKNYDNPEALAEFLEIKQKEVLVESEEINRRLLLLDTAIKNLRQDETAMNYNVSLKTLPERYVASVKKTISTYKQEGELWDILMKETAMLKMQNGNPSYAMAIYHDKEFRESDVNVEVQKTVSGKYTNTKNVVFKTEPAIYFASATFKGSYENLYDVNEAVANWVNDNGYIFTGLAFNIYHVSPNKTQDPNKYITEVCYPIKQK